MRPILAFVALLAVAGCSTSPPQCANGPSPGMEKSWNMACGGTPTATTTQPEQAPQAVDPDAGKPWCERNQSACIALLPVLLPLALAEEVARQFPAAFLNAAANSSTYSDTVRTPNGTYDVHSFCVSGSCDTTVRKR